VVSPAPGRPSSSPCPACFHSAPPPRHPSQTADERNCMVRDSPSTHDPSQRVRAATPALLVTSRQGFRTRSRLGSAREPSTPPAALYCFTTHRRPLTTCDARLLCLPLLFKEFKLTCPPAVLNPLKSCNTHQLGSTSHSLALTSTLSSCDRTPTTRTR
jgi:hypothetical protein